MPIRHATDIHRINHPPPQRPTPVLTEADYRQAHAGAMVARGIIPFASPDQPAPSVEGWKWVVKCTSPDCDNRPMWGWGIACCFDCGATYTGLVLPDEADEIERLLAFRPKLSQRTWLLTETLDNLREQNLSIGVDI